jgi:hypothetical protein
VKEETGSDEAGDKSKIQSGEEVDEERSGTGGGRRRGGGGVRW